MGKKRGQGNEGTFDQFGEHGKSQDRDEAFQFTGKGMTGGGSARGPSKTAVNITYERQVPKFLQKYSHMLGKNDQYSEEPVVVKNIAKDRAESDDDDDQDVEVLQRALQDNPELAAEFGEKFEKKARAAKEKEKGNEAFAAKDFAKAIGHFTTCIELDPENEVFYSNRSAAHASSGAWAEALRDAESAIALKPRWAKAHARAAAALTGMGRHSDALEAYERALTWEPDDAGLRKAMEKAQCMEAQQVRDHKHVFTKRSRTEVNTGRRSKDSVGKAEQRESSLSKPSAGASSKASALLSFGDEDG